MNGVSGPTAARDERWRRPSSERRDVAAIWLRRAETFIHEIDERVIGLVALVGNEVGGIFVHPEHQGRGIGRALMDHARSSRRRAVSVVRTRVRGPSCSSGREGMRPSGTGGVRSLEVPG